MRKFLLLCLMAIGYCGTSFAQFTLAPDQELSVISDGDIVAIWQKTTNRFLYGSSNQDLGFGYAEDAFKESNSGWLFKVEEAEGHFLFLLQKPAGGDYGIWGSPGYLNSQPGGGVSFILGLNHDGVLTWGQDGENLALWDIEEVEGGFLLYNVGNNGYLKDNSAANHTIDDAAVWTFCTLADVSPLKSDNLKLLESWIVNGDLEGDDYSSFPLSYDGPNNNESAEDPLTVVAEGKDGSKCIKITSFPEPTESWHTQLYLKTNETIPTGTKWMVKLSAKADQEDVKITSSAQAAPRQWKPGSGIPEFYVGTEWKDYTFTGTIDVADDAFQSFALDLNNGDEEVTNTAGDGTAMVNREVTFWFDNFEFGLYTKACDLQYNSEAIRVLFPEYTNLPDLIALAGKSRLMFATDCVTVTVDGQAAPVQSVEADKKGNFMIFLDEDWVLENELTEKNKVVVKFTNPTDEKFQVKYLDDDNTVAPDFEEEATFNEDLDIESNAWAAPELLTSDPETGSFNLPATTNSIKVTFDKKVRSKMLEAKLDGKEKLTVSPQDEEGNAEVTLTRTGTDPLAAGDHVITITSVYTWTQYAVPVGTEDAPVTLTFSVGEPAMSSELSAAIAAGQAMIENCESETGRYLGAAYTALQEAIAKYEAEGATYTAPSQLRAALKDLQDKTKALENHKSNCDTYDTDLQTAEQIVAEKAETKFAAHEIYTTLAAAVAQYSGKELTDDAELETAVKVLSENVTAANNMFTEGASKLGDCGIMVLVERLRLGAEALLALGVDEENEAVVLANNALSDDDNLAEVVKNNVKMKVYEALKDEATAAAMFESTEETDGDGEIIVTTPEYDMSVFIKNPNIYRLECTKESADGNVPGWTTDPTVGLYCRAWNPNGGDRGISNLPEDCAFSNWNGNVYFEQVINDLPAGTYTVVLYCENWANSADSYAFCKTSDAVEVGEDEEFDKEIHTTAYVPFESTTSRVEGVPLKMEGIEVKDGKLTIGVQFERFNAANDNPEGVTVSQHMFDQAKLYLTGPASGFNYVAAYESIAQGIETASNAKVRSQQFFDLNGRQIKKANKGIVIVRKVMGDGTVKTSKVVK